MKVKTLNGDIFEVAVRCSGGELPDGFEQHNGYRVLGIEDARALGGTLRIAVRDGGGIVIGTSFPVVRFPHARSAPPDARA
jgi:hypothetical protein